MTDKLTEIKSKLQEATDLIKEYELLEEARRRGYVSSRKIKCLYSGKEYNGGQNFSFNGQDLWINSPGYIGFVIKIYDSEDNRWAEIIPEEEKSFPLGVKVESEVLIETKSLHDQIREGGWDKVWELAGNEFDFQTIHSRPLADKMVEKTVNYIKLLALSKVLNEGKEQKGYFYFIRCREGKIIVDTAVVKYIYEEVFEFCNKNDAHFALEFAEKEWKIFYNAK